MPQDVITDGELANRFAYHSPTDQAAAHRHSRVRFDCLDLALKLKSAIPPSRERALAITKLEEVMFWANAAIARSDT